MSAHAVSGEEVPRKWQVVPRDVLPRAKHKELIEHLRLCICVCLR